MTDLGTALAILRLVRGWSQEDLAKASGLRSGTISDYERGKMVPGLTTAKRLLAAVGYTWAAVDLAQDFILRLRAESLESSSSVEQNGEDPSALRREIEEVSTVAGKALTRIIRLLLTTLLQGAGKPEEGSGASEGKAA